MEKKAYKGRWLGLRIALPPSLHLLADIAGCLVYPDETAARYTHIGTYLGDFTVITAALYLISEGNVHAYFWLERRLPWSRGPGKRVLAQALIGWLWTVLVTAALLLLLRQPEMGMTREEATGSILTLTSLFTLVILGVFIYYSMKSSIATAERLSRESLEAQNIALRQQVDPHFLFNSLNTIASLIPDDPHAAEKLVQALAKVYRYVLASKEQTLITLAEELEMVKEYAYAFTCRFGEGFRFSVEVPDIYCTRLVPPLTLQLLVENCVKHNIVSSRQPLHVRIEVQGGWLVVRNNLQRRPAVDPSMTMGLENIRNRYRLLKAEEIQIHESNGEFAVSCPIIQ